jgi:uncharacterized protein YbjT (DUF2867 family)
MFIIVGGTGHVGTAITKTLLDQKQPVAIVTRTASKAKTWRERAADVAVVNVRDVDALREVFRQGRRAFLLNPNGDPASDTDREERATVRCLLKALEGSGLEKVVAQSTYGARPGERCGDLTVLHEFEQGLKAQRIPVAIMRSAYMMSNWDAFLDSVRETGLLPSMLPANLRLPMVAPDDLGRAAAQLLREPVEDTKVHHVEGPERYTPTDVAAAFERALNRPVDVQVTPRERWEETFRTLGFSEAAARSYACMTGVTVDEAEEYEPRSPPFRGSVTLIEYTSTLVRERGAADAP